MLNRLPPLRETPSQTAGPYVHIGLTPSREAITSPNVRDFGAEILGTSAAGPPIIVTGRIFDGSDAPVTDAVVELWQADAEGRYGAEGFGGWGRAATDTDGRYRFETIKPGRVPGPDGKPMAPHLTLWIVARGINVALHTRIYFADESDANMEDVVLNRIQDARRRQTLLASYSDMGGMPAYALDIRLQGDNETVFFDF